MSVQNFVTAPGEDSALESEALRLRKWIAAASKVALFTGAGLSTECGVPDFRSPGSPWMINKPIAFQAFLNDPAMRVEAWRRKFAMDDHYRGAVPGRGHLALARLVRSGQSAGVITQNIDNLHQASGLAAEEVVELHGNGSYAACLDCGRRHELDVLRTRFEAEGTAPECMECSGPVKSATISFGQRMPVEAMETAMRWSSSCDLFLAIGTSLLVQPAARLPLIAKQAGARLVIVNAEPTPLDAAADDLLRGDIGTVLALAVP